MQKIEKILLLICFIFLLCNQSYSAINNKVIASVGKMPITTLDLQNEMKLIFITEKEKIKNYSNEQLQQLSFQSVVGRLIRKQEIELHENINFSENDLKREMEAKASRMGLSLSDLGKIFISNKISIELLEDKIITELKWNSLIFQIYKNRLNVNQNVIEEKLKKYTSMQHIKEYKISEILAEIKDSENVNSVAQKVKNKIKKDGFESAAIQMSIASSSEKGGSLGWLKETEISEKFKKFIENTKIGNVTEPIFLPQGVMFMKVNEVRKIKIDMDLEKVKNNLIRNEKIKSLESFSILHFKKAQKSTSLEVFE